VDEQVIEKVNLASGDVVTEHIEQLKALFPETAVEAMAA